MSPLEIYVFCISISKRRTSYALVTKGINPRKEAAQILRLPLFSKIPHVVLFFNTEIDQQVYKESTCTSICQLNQPPVAFVNVWHFLTNNIMVSNYMQVYTKPVCKSQEPLLTNLWHKEEGLSINGNGADIRMQTSYSVHPPPPS
jgi:hypothetical protein